MADDSIDALPRTRKEAKERGLRHYFTGCACKNGHVAVRFASTRQCSACVADHTKGRRLADPEEARRWSRDNNRKRLRERGEHVRNIKRLWREKNIAKVMEANRAYAASNREQEKTRARKWYRDHKERARASRHSRRSREQQADGFHTGEDIKRIRKAQKDRCAMPDCQCKLNGGGHLDHIVALSKSGTNWPRNLQLLCAFCNVSKKARDPIEFAQSRGLLV